MRRDRPSLARKTSPFVAAFAAAVGVLGALAAVDAGYGERSQAEQRQHVQDQLSSVRASLEAALHARLQLVRGLAAFVRAGGGEDEGAFERFAAELVGDHAGIRSVQLAPRSVVRYVHPREGNEQAIGHDLVADVTRRDPVLRAIRERRFIVAGPTTLRQGGVGLIARLPVFVTDGEEEHERYWGLAVMVLDLQRLLEDAGLATAPPGLRLAVRGREGFALPGEAFVGDDALFSNADALVAHVHLPGGSWQIAALPALGWTRSWDGRGLAWGGALVLALALAVLAFQLVREPARLKQAVARATAALQRSEAKYRGLVESTSDWVWEVDANGVYTYASPKIRDLLGYEVEEVLGRTPFDLMPPAEARRVGAEFGAIAAARRPFDGLVNVNSHRDGHPVVLETSGVPVFDDKGAFVGYRGIDRDITARKETEDRLRLAATVFETATEAIMVADADTRIKAVNPAFTQITGYAPEEAIGQTPRLLRSGRHDREFYEQMWAALRETGRWAGEVWNRRKGGQLYPEWLSIKALHHADGSPAEYVAVFSDITRRKEDETRIWRQANFDPLTGLPNRTLLMDRLVQAMARARRSGRTLALLFVDLDRFKWINDSFGHAVGDRLLQDAAERIQLCVREYDTVARLGGDEFMVIVSDLGEPAGAETVATKILEQLARPFLLKDEEAFIGGSIGITVFPTDGDEPETLFRNADAAMYRAKESGRHCYQFFTREMNLRAMERVSLERDMHRALDGGELVVHYQPIVDFRTGRLSGAEALLRWRHPTRGWVAPCKFIPLAEETGFILQMGEWVLREVCRQGAAWLASGGAPMSLAVNVSRHQLRSAHFEQKVISALEDTGFPAASLVLEITESAVMDNPDTAIALMTRLGARGVRFSLDDFGTGYSSLSDFKRLPVEILKIDRSFVRDATANEDDQVLIRTMIAMGGSMGVRVVAEGVETQDQFELLRNAGCVLGQGHYFSVPLSAGDFERFAADLDVAHGEARTGTS